MVTTNKTTSSITIIIQSNTEMVITTDASIEMGKNLLHTVYLGGVYLHTINIAH